MYVLLTSSTLPLEIVFMNEVIFAHVVENSFQCAIPVQSI